MSPTTGTNDQSYRSLDTHDASAAQPWADEMSRVLSLWAAQIDAAIGESHKELEELSESYFSVAREAVAALESGPPETAGRAKLIEEQVHAALVKFQVSDRLMQRLMNVKAGLLVLGDLLQDESALKADKAWQSALELIRSSYTMAAERRMFDAAVRRTDETGASAVDMEETGHRLVLFGEDDQE